MKPKDVLDAAATRLTEEKVETSGPVTTNGTTS